MWSIFDFYRAYNFFLEIANTLGFFAEIFRALTSVELIFWV